MYRLYNFTARGQTPFTAPPNKYVSAGSVGLFVGTNGNGQRIRLVSPEIGARRPRWNRPMHFGRMQVNRSVLPVLPCDRPGRLCDGTRMCVRRETAENRRMCSPATKRVRITTYYPSMNSWPGSARRSPVRAARPSYQTHMSIFTRPEKRRARPTVVVRLWRASTTTADPFSKQKPTKECKPSRRYAITVCGRRSTTVVRHKFWALNGAVRTALGRIKPEREKCN